MPSDLDAVDANTAAAEPAILRPARADDADAIAAIYNHYVINTAISFEETAVEGAVMAARIAAVQDGGLPWLVAERGGVLQGYAYTTPWRSRPAYRHSVETSVYLAAAACGVGLGAALYGALLEQLRSGGAHLAIGGIALPNPASVALHEKCGFEQVAHFKEVGLKFGEWRDVGYWQRLL